MRKHIILGLAALGLLITAIVIWRVYLLLRLRATIAPRAAYWRNESSAVVRPGDFIYVALGDSAAQGIGASSPSLSYVGLTATRIAAITGRHVHIVNLSKTGAKVHDVLVDQLPKLASLHPDLVTLDIGANDVVHATPSASFYDDFGQIIAQLPPGNTVVADLPAFGNSARHKVVADWNETVHSTISTRGLLLAPLHDYTARTERDWSTYAADSFHPSDKGYANWYLAFKAPVETALKSRL